MARKVFSYITQEDNLLNRAQIQADNVDSRYPESNLTELPVSKPIRIGAISGQKILIDFAEVIEADFCALVFHNFTGTSTILLRAGTLHDPDGSQFQQTVPFRRRTQFSVFPETQFFRHWAFVLTDESNTSGFLSIGYAILGKLSNIEHGYRFGASFEDLILNQEEETEFGTPIISHLTERQTTSITFRDGTDTELEDLRSLFFALKKNQKGLFILPDREGALGYFGRLRDDYRRIATPPDKFTTSMTIIEDPPGRVVVEPLPIYKPAMLEGPPKGSIFARNSTALYKDRTLTLREAAIDEIRDVHYFDVNKRGVLIEGSRTNAWTHSEALDSAVWTKVNVTVQADETSGPRGLQTADRLQETATAGVERRIDRAPPTLTDNTFSSVSVFVKPDERSIFWLLVRSKDNKNRRIYFNADTGEFGTATGALTSTRFSKERYRDNWWRLTATFDAESGGTAPLVAVGLTTADNVLTYDGDGSSGAFVTGLQFETDQPLASSYIFTDDSTVTRARDEFSLPSATMISPEPITIYAKFVGTSEHVTAGVSDDLIILQIAGEGGNEPRFQLASRPPGNLYRIIHRNAVPTEVSSALSRADFGDTIELRGVIHPNGSVQLGRTINGGSEAVGSISSVLNFESDWNGNLRFWFGSSRTFSLQGAGVYQEIKAVRGAQTRAFMRNL